VDGDVLARAGISASLVPRTMQAMQSLDLIDADGRPTDVLEGIRLAPEAEYRQRLKEWLSSAYADALMFVDPATDDEAAIRDAFRKYRPVGQQSRMVTLFTGLFRAAGVGPEKDRAAPRKPTGATGVTKPAGKTKAIVPPLIPPVGREYPAAGHLPPALAGLLASLPSVEEGWTKEKREQFVLTFGAVLDFCIPVVSGKQNASPETEMENK
jgi:hypothetical protein